MAEIYAIDYGTSNSLLCKADKDHVSAPLEVDPQGSDSSILRSVMYFPDNQRVYFGQKAIEEYALDDCQGRLFRSIKKYLPNAAFTGTRVGNRHYNLENLIGTFLREMKSRADSIAGKDIENVVLGRPAKFSMDSEKDKLAQTRLEKAAKEAGFKHIEFFAEPLAAAYDYRQNIKEEKILFIADLGGGTSDFRVVKILPPPKNQQEVLSLGGISLAGDALDGSIMRHRLAGEFGADVKYKMALSENILEMPKHIRDKLCAPADVALMTRTDIREFLNEVGRSTLKDEDDVRMERLTTLVDDNLGFQIFEKIENSKREACINGHAEFDFDYPDIELKAEYQYKDFLEWSGEVRTKIFEVLDETLKQSGVKAEDIDLVCCTGGTSKVPAIVDALTERFPQIQVQGFNQFHSVIQGLARRAQELI